MKTIFLKSLFFLFLGAIIGGPGIASGQQSGNGKTEVLQQLQLRVTGLKCKSCIPDVRKSLQPVPGVREVRIVKFDKAGSDTVVEVIPGTVSGEQLISALEASGFRGEILFIGQPREVILEKEPGFSFFGLFN